MIGIIGLDTRFAKPPGHIRNPATFAYPVRYAVVAGAITPQRVVIEADPALLEPFLDAAPRPGTSGLPGDHTACGFLVLFPGRTGVGGVGAGPRLQPAAGAAGGADDRTAAARRHPDRARGSP